ncbi:MAG: biotin--[acetyl-CoA-carboxylase] ligase [Alphaproteobacteria bacterium]
MGIDWHIETHETVRSTQELLKEMARMNEPEGKVVHAFEQSKGHGRHGRPWVSEKGNLYLSFLLRPDCQAQRITQFSLLTANALAETILSFIDEPEKLMLKWPNDVFLDGQKCAGILLETEIAACGAVRWLVVGVGVNIHNPPLDIGVGVQNFTKQSVDLLAFRDSFLKNMANAYSDWNTEPFDSIRQKWLSKAHKPGTPMKIKIGTQIEQGIFHDLDKEGNLMLQDGQQRIKTVSAGEVHFLTQE